MEKTKGRIGGGFIFRLRVSAAVLLLCGAASLLLAVLFEHSFIFINIALYFFWMEIFLSASLWAFSEDNWPSIIAAGWLLACTLGVWKFSGSLYQPGTLSLWNFFHDHCDKQSMIIETISFLKLFLIGYIALRFGMILGNANQTFSRFSEKISLLLSPEIIAPKTCRISLLMICFLSCIGICAIYAHFGSIPILSDNPPLARYQFFNGPFTNNLYRFFFRIFSALSLASALYLIALPKATFSLSTKISAYFCICFTLLCALASGSRGDFLALVLFIAVVFIFSRPLRQRLLSALFAATGGVAVFCMLTAYRLSSALNSLYGVFPEISDGALMMASAKAHDVPLAFGKTYLAAILSFIPSSLCPFRETYGFGRYSLKILYLGIDRPIAPTYGGLRPTFVGEAALNGGMVGVVIVGLFLGVILGTYRCRQDSLKSLSGSWVLFFLLSLLTVMVSDFYGVFHGLALVAFLVWLVEEMASSHRAHP